MKSNKRAICRAFTYSEFEIYDKNNINYLSGGSLNTAFFAYKADLDGYSLATYITTICEDITGEEAEAGLILRATLNSFYAIEKQLYPYEQIKAAYELFAAAASGFTPDLSCCEGCKHVFEEKDSFWLDVMNGSLLCSECKAKRPTNSDSQHNNVDQFETRNILIPLDLTSLAAMRYCINAPIQRLFSFSITDEKSKKLFYRAAESYLLHHLERGFQTLNFYYKIKD